MFSVLSVCSGETRIPLWLHSGPIQSCSLGDLPGPGLLTIQPPPKNMFKLGAHHTGTPPPWPTQLESRWLTFDWIALLYLLCHYNVFSALSRNKDTCTSNVNEVLLSKSPQKSCEMGRKPSFLVVALLHRIPLTRRSVTRSTRGQT